MGLFRNKVPEDLISHLEDGEHVIAWANHSGGKIIVTNRNLLSLDHHQNLKFPWHLALWAKWEEPVLQVAAQDELTGPAITRAWNISNPGLVPDSIRERVTSSQIFDQLRELPGIGKVRFLARRSESGIHWVTLTDLNLDIDSQNHIETELLQLRQSLGI